MDVDKTNILIVDDLPEKLLVWESILEELGQNIVRARGGQDALRQVMEREFAVILLDVNMPDMDGYETAALIRRRKKSAHTPIIFVTSYADEVHAAQAYTLGAVDFILAPVAPEILRTKVRVFVDLLRMTQQVKRQAQEQVALAHEQAARSAAEETVHRLNFLAEASKGLASSLDLSSTLRTLLRLVVPRYGDLAAVNLVNDHAQIVQTEIAWIDAAGATLSRSLAGPEGLHVRFAEAVDRAIEKRKPVFLEIAENLDMQGTSESGRGWAAITRNGELGHPQPELRSMLVLPLFARGHALGVLAVAMGHSSRRLEPADLALVEDLAHRAAIAIDNARLYGDVQEADRRKNEFLSMLAHELRNPLAPLMNGIHILRLRDHEPSALHPVHDMMTRQLHHLVRLVDDLLDVSRITRDKIQLRLENVEVSAVVARAVEVSRPLLDSRNHDFTATLPREPLTMHADPIRLAQVLSNLLNNAAKYTETGGKVWLNVESKGPEILFRVGDNGVGIPPEMLASVFNLFTQVERSLDRSQGGLGIGLTLVRRLVEMHGGVVQAFSAGPNQGSEFVIRLPAHKEEAASDLVKKPTQGAGECRD